MRIFKIELLKHFNCSSWPSSRCLMLSCQAVYHLHMCVLIPVCYKSYSGDSNLKEDIISSRLTVFNFVMDTYSVNILYCTILVSASLLHHYISCIIYILFIYVFFFNLNCISSFILW